MAMINYHHLWIFWTVARIGSMTRATRTLHLTQSTISGQIVAFEEALGVQLFERTARGVGLTEAGHVVERYAEEIFTLGRELSDTLERLPTGRPSRLRVGVADGVPKLLTYRLLEPVLSMSPPVALSVREADVTGLLAQLTSRDLDLALLDVAPETAGAGTGLVTHLLGECDLTIVGTAPLARRVRRGFPTSLRDAPFLVPGPGSTQRRLLEGWFARIGVAPRIVAEFQDSAALKAFGGHGAGLFAVPSAVTRDVNARFGTHVAGVVPELREHYYAVTAPRRFVPSAFARILDAARVSLFT